MFFFIFSTRLECVFLVGPPSVLFTEVLVSEQGVFNPLASVPSRILIRLRDSAGNIYQKSSNVEVDVQLTCTFLNSGGGVVTAVRAVPLNPLASDGLYVASYVLTKRGVYTLRVKLGGVDVSNSPLSVRVGSGPPSALTTIVRGPGALQFVAGVPTSFEVEVRDAYNNTVDDPSLWSVDHFKVGKNTLETSGED